MTHHARSRRAARFVLHLCALALILTLSGCGLLNEEPPFPTAAAAPPNMLANPGFENGADPWRTSPDNAFAVAEDIARGGQRSAALALQRSVAGGDASIVVQTLNTNQFPEFVSGFYRAENWERDGDTQWFEFSVRILGGSYGDDLPVHTLRFVIAGVDALPPPLFGVEPPGVVTTFLRRGGPESGWSYFSFPVREAFLRAFDAEPVGWTNVELEVALQCRAAECTQGATVYVDDLYAGTQAGNTNAADAD